MEGLKIFRQEISNTKVEDKSDYLGSTSVETRSPSHRFSVGGYFTKTLSICICHFDSQERNMSLKKLWNELNNQIERNNVNDKVKILIETDKGQLSVGNKRNSLINKCSTDYIAFIDDDDMISEDYIEQIFRTLNSEEDLDILFIKINHIIDGKLNKVIIPSINIENEINSTQFTKNYFHLCPHKLSISKKVLFLNMSFAEDKEYSNRLSLHINKSKYIDNPIYIYLDDSSKSLK